MRIRFTQDVQAETEGRHKGPVYKAGFEDDFPLPSAHRWLRRGVAVEVTVEPRRIKAERPMMTAAPKVAPEKAPEPKLAKEPEPAAKAAEPEPKAEPKPAAAPAKTEPKAAPTLTGRGRHGG